MMRVYRPLACILLLAGHLSAQQPGGPILIAGYRIVGTLVHAITGQPLPGTTVMAEAAEQGAWSQTTSTDLNGRFLFLGVPAGRYRISAKGRGFPEQAFGSYGALYEAVAVGPNKQSQTLVFRLRPEGSISGRVMNDRGEAIRNARVLLFISRLGEHAIALQATADTRDDGCYRFSHLAGGKYFIAVSAHPWYAQYTPPAASSVPSTEGQLAGSGAEMDVAYPITYYRDTAEPDAATPIVLNWGEHPTADINVQAVPAVRLQLTNRNPNSSLSIVGVTLKQSIIGGNETLVDAETVASGPGRLEIRGLAPGRYDVGVEIPKPGHGEANSVPRHQILDIAGDTELDVSRGSEFVTVAGSIRFEGANPPAEAQVELRSRDSGHILELPVGAKGEVEALDVSPGYYDVSLQKAGNFAIKSMLALHAQVAGQSLAIDGPEDVQLRLIAAKGSAQIEGLVISSNKPAPAAVLVLAPEDPYHNRGLIRGNLSATDGSFIFSDLLPGNYMLFATSKALDLPLADPSAWQRYLPQARPFQVEAGRKSHITLELK